ncbi:superoxide dismutase family protein [Qipengyuania sediminis]|uniref:superoxide dismutase family protein n=1 Tax=Qipengyuania sediminis TaxID=1532023 RepID=UPI001F0FC334|nr:superoxide dismutase family protein [Qipengyuania sediminis]
MPTATLGETTLLFANGSPAGTARLMRDGSGVSIAVAVSGMAPGPKGYHLHTAGRCEAPKFESAGGHLNPDNRRHGTLASGGAHLGDLPNLQVGSDGTARATEVVAGGEAALASIFDADGTAVIVHAQADDYRTDPSGNSGERVACGVLRRTG